jgi:hypothetical protein
MQVKHLLLLAVLALPLSARADNPADTTPITVGKITYLVPNIHKPGGKQIMYRDCVAGSNCRYLRVILSNTGVTAKQWFEMGVKELEKMNGSKIIPQAGPSGYQVYKLTVPNSKPNQYASDAGSIEFYVNTELDIYFNCVVRIKKGYPDYRLCANIFSLADGNLAEVAFPLAQAEELPDIEAGIRKLVASFATQPAQ